MDREMNINAQNKEYGKNREKLLKHEINKHMKEYAKEKEMTMKEQDLKKSISKAYTKKTESSNVLQSVTTNVVNIFSKTNYHLFSILGIPTKFNELNYYAKWWKICDVGITICNFLVMLLAIYDYEINFSYPRRIVNNYSIVRVLMILISMLSIFFVLRRHYHKQKWRNVKLIEIKGLSSYTPESEHDIYRNESSLFIGGKKRSFFKKGLFMEIFINLLIPYPYLDFRKTMLEIDRDNQEYIKVEYLFSDFLYVFVIFRVIYVVRSTINYSIFTDHYANTIAKEYNVKCNIRFALKCILKTEHFKIVFIFFVASNILFGFALRVFERPFWVAKGRLEFEYFSNSFWLVFITMTTIGYGDFSPYTNLGKLILFFAALWGTFICSLVVVCLYGLLDLSNDQFLVFVKIVKSRTAIEFIEKAFIFRKAKLNRKRLPINVKSSYEDLVSSFKDFRNMRNESKSVYRSNGLIYYNMKLLKEINKLNRRFDKVEMDIENLATPSGETTQIIKKHNG
jgi:hypothetical protein